MRGVHSMTTPPTSTPSEKGALTRGLSHRQATMIGIGGAIGTGLFLGSTLAISSAGPAVIISYLIGAGIALIVAWALAEMTVVHPTRGSFGAIGQSYLGPWAGFVIRWTYWIAQIVAVGGEVIAAGTYVQYWWPSIPLWVPVVVFSALLLVVNATAVKFFGEFEFWFASIKVTAIGLFVLLGIAYLTVGLPGHSAVGVHQLTANGGFLPNGLTGVWLSMLIVIFSFYGIEVISVTAPETKEPERTVPHAIRSMLLRLTLFYIASITIIVAVVPWNAKSTAHGILASPFVRIFDVAGIPAAASVMNFVVLTAALSSMNTNLYLTTRMAHSLSHDGYAPAVLGRTTKTGSPRNALVISALGLALAAYLSVASPGKAYFALFGISIFGGIAVWILILATLVAFRRIREQRGMAQSPVRLPGGMATPVIGIALLIGILLACFKLGLAIAWEAGVPYLAVISVVYAIVARRRAGGAETRPLLAHSADVPLAERK
ncbi:amino acid permease [Streptomyces sp. NPDC046900]|uniref:amino acid permease n=2 Tax=unclassified Streptomyces TaxID=2593676 RepID=UPI0033EBBAC4